MRGGDARRAPAGNDEGYPRDGRRFAPRSSKGDAPRSAGDNPPLRRHDSSARPPDRRSASHAVLDQVQESTAAETDIAALVRSAQAGDRLAFAELYVAFFDRVHRYLLVAVKNHDDAQELAQDVFARVVASLHSYDAARGTFRDWLFAAVRNKALDHLRRAGRQEPVAPDDIVRYMPSIADRAAALSERFEPSIDVGAIVDSLPEAQRRAIVLRFVYDMNAIEIAEVVGGTPDAVRHTQHRALKAIAARLETAA